MLRAACNVFIEDVHLLADQWGAGNRYYALSFPGLEARKHLALSHFRISRQEDGGIGLSNS